MNLFTELFGVGDLTFNVSAVIRLLLAALLGGAIGFEREHSNHPAGLRTHTLVCLGASLVMIMSEFLYIKYGSSNDPARLGAQVISGIGFLGAGAILKDGFSVRGLTTAASLWAVSCVGLAVGVGFYLGAIVSTALILVILLIVKQAMEKQYNRAAILLTVSDPELLEEVECILENRGITVESTAIFASRGDKYHELRINVRTDKISESVPPAIDEILMLPGVREISMGKGRKNRSESTKG